jgi:peptidylprolyl isomerase
MKKLFIGVVTLIALAALLAGCGGSPAATTSTSTTPASTTTLSSTTTVDSNRTAQDGDIVSVNYIGTLEDGTKFDASYDRGEPLTFLLGSGQMIAGFDAAVHGMKVGETKTVTLLPDQAYGEHLDSYVITMDQSKFPEGTEFAIGQQVTLTSATGQQVPGVIVDIGPGTVTIDINHQFAGQTLIFVITLESITPAGN